jgi:hypothetical protein
MAPGVLFCRKSNVSIPSKQQACSLPQGGPACCCGCMLQEREMQENLKAIPHNSKCRYGERGAADAKPKAQIILDAAKVSAASGGNSEPKQGQRSQSARGFCPRSTMRVPQPDIIEHFGNADAVPQPPERCLSRQAGIVRCCLKTESLRLLAQCSRRFSVKFPIHPKLMAK